MCKRIGFFFSIKYQECQIEIQVSQNRIHWLRYISIFDHLLFVHWVLLIDFHLVLMNDELVHIQSRKKEESMLYLFLLSMKIVR